MKRFDHILNWKLMSGSHKFPGPDGGTCINEAAVVAAGFEYRAIGSVADCPPCFSPVIAAYALALNDNMADGLRQRLLMPFVTRLAGTRDTDEIERLRASHIALETIRRILSRVLYAVGLTDHAVACEQAQTLSAAADAAAAAAADATCTAYAAYAAGNAAYAARTAGSVARVARVAAVTAAAARAAYAVAAAFTIAVTILDEAICLGNQAEPIETALVIERMDAVKRASACMETAS